MQTTLTHPINEITHAERERRIGIKNLVVFVVGFVLDKTFLGCLAQAVVSGTHINCIPCHMQKGENRYGTNSLWGNTCLGQMQFVPVYLQHAFSTQGKKIE